MTRRPRQDDPALELRIADDAEQVGDVLGALADVLIELSQKAHDAPTPEMQEAQT